MPLLVEKRALSLAYRRFLHPAVGLTRPITDSYALSSSKRVDGLGVDFGDQRTPVRGSLVVS